MDGLCMADFAPFQARGLWSTSDAKSFLSRDVVLIHLQIALIYTVSQSICKLFKPFNLAQLVCEILAGVILGPSVLGVILPGVFNALFPQDGCVYLELLTKLGYIFFMFIMGVKMDPSMVLKSGQRPWTIAILSILIPTGYALTISSIIPENTVDVTKLPTIKVVVAAQTFSSFPVIACLLIDLKIINSELGRIALATSLIKDLLSTMVQTVMFYLRIGNAANYMSAGITMFCFASFVATIVFLCHPLFLWIIKQTPEGKPVKSVYINIICFAAIVSAFLSDNLGVAFQLGPFILGLTVPSGPPLGSTLEKKFGFTMGLLVPMLVTYSGIKTNINEIYDLKLAYVIWMIYIFGAIAKVTGVLIPALLCKMSAKDALALGLIMSTQGIVELAGYVTHMQNKTLDEETFTMAIFSVLATAVVMPLLVRSVYDYSRTYIGYQKRNILYSSNDAELRIVACAHRQDDAMAIINVLEASNPTKQSPISVFALHLVELVGGTSPLMINHQLGQKTTSSSLSSRSQPIIDIFNYYENAQHNSGLVNVNAFTAISMPKFMHDDVCLLAFDKLASLIILPFHKKWNSQGKVVFDNNIRRNINSQVMDMAPCSVGILIDRRKVHQTPTSLSSPSLYRVAVIFLGGDDDREALAYAKRMANSPGVHLTVFRLSPWDNTGEENWESILDAETVKDIRLQCSVKGNVVYREDKVKDGPDTALLIHSMEEDFDLIMVGRRHKLGNQLLSGLTEWTVLPELGEIGDLLASPEIDRPVSVLVVQQQHMQK